MAERRIRRYDRRIKRLKAEAEKARSVKDYHSLAQIGEVIQAEEVNLRLVKSLEQAHSGHLKYGKPLEGLVREMEGERVDKAIRRMKDFLRQYERSVRLERAKRGSAPVFLALFMAVNAPNILSEYFLPITSLLVVVAGIGIHFLHRSIQKWTEAHLFDRRKRDVQNMILRLFLSLFFCEVECTRVDRILGKWAQSK